MVRVPLLVVGALLGGGNHLVLVEAALTLELPQSVERVVLAAFGLVLAAAGIAHARDVIKV
jgi:hypothetical protein